MVGLAIQITDTGIGIAAEGIPRVLGPVGQVIDSMTRNHEGVGLGLSIINSLVKVYGGAMRIESVVDMETTVTVRFPL